MLGGDFFANSRKHILDFALLAAFHFVNDHQPLPTFDVDDYRGAQCPGREPRVAFFGRVFDILWVVVQPVDDDQVFEPAGDEQFAVAQKAEIAGPQNGPSPESAKKALNVRSVSSGRFQ